jgi:hypothetical protein
MGAIQQLLAAYGSAAATTDPNFASVVLLHNCTEANGATTFIDSSSFARTITTLGNAALSTTSPPSGANGSVTMDGNGDSFRVANSTDFDLTSVFTAECFLKTSSLHASGLTVIGGLRAASGNDNGVFFYVSSASGPINLVVANNGLSDSGVGGNTSISNGAWQHFMVSGDGTNYHIGLNGTIYVRFARTRSPGASNGNWYWGSWNGETGTRNWSGQIGPSRVTKGVCRYAAAAGSPYTIPTLPFPTSA